MTAPTETAVEALPPLDPATKAAAKDHVETFIGLLQRGDVNGADQLASENVVVALVLEELTWVV